MIEFKLGVRGKPDVPERDSESWCRYIDQLVGGRGSGSSTAGSASAPAAAKKATSEHPPRLQAEQRGWIKGRNESLWEHQGQALITWGYDAPELRCTKRC